MTTNQEVDTKRGAQKVREERDKKNRTMPLWTCSVGDLRGNIQTWEFGCEWWGNINIALSPLKREFAL